LPPAADVNGPNLFLGQLFPASPQPVMRDHWPIIEISILQIVLLP
jgi:hypothetical protein